jgi:glycosyltransferase involved in cell wall biosynthesis
MKVALVTSSYLPHSNGRERHVHELARGLARRGAQVEVLVQGAVRGVPTLAEGGGVVVRRFPTVVGPGRLATAPGLWDRLRVAAETFDVADVHTARTPLAQMVARAGFRPLVFTPHAPVKRLVRWPYARAMRAVAGDAAQIVCRSNVEADLLRGRFPWAGDRIAIVPTGVDAGAIRAARPFPHTGRVVLAVGRLERHKRVDRAIAAMASLDPAYRLVVVGNGPARHRLHAYAADLQVSSSVEFVGPVSDRDLYRWLRTGHVVVALAEQEDSGLQVTEALAAGAAVVASDIPVHREAASEVDGARVIFVSPEGSPLEVADAISEAAGLGVRPQAEMARLAVPSWDSVVSRMLDLYETLIPGGPPAVAGATDSTAKLPVQIRSAQAVDARDLTVHG